MTNDDWGMVLLAFGAMSLTLGGYSFMVASFFVRGKLVIGFGTLCLALGLICLVTLVFTL